MRMPVRQRDDVAGIEQHALSVLQMHIGAPSNQVMGVGSRRDWRISLTLDEVVAIKS
jgi:hypothetical protein